MSRHFGRRPTTTHPPRVALLNSVSWKYPNIPQILPKHFPSTPGCDFEGRFGVWLGCVWELWDLAFFLGHWDICHPFWVRSFWWDFFVLLFSMCVCVCVCSQRDESYRWPHVVLEKSSDKETWNMRCTKQSWNESQKSEQNSEDESMHEILAILFNPWFHVSGPAIVRMIHTVPQTNQIREVPILARRTNPAEMAFPRANHNSSSSSQLAADLSLLAARVAVLVSTHVDIMAELCSRQLWRMGPGGSLFWLLAGCGALDSSLRFWGLSRPPSGLSAMFFLTPS